MSKKCKASSKFKNLQAKRARKTANKAYYQALTAADKNSKSGRSIKSSKKKKRVKTIDHKDGNCGNVACRKCDPGRVFGNAA